ncbi:QueT transporter family protein [Candidatus Bathyarchaeota archaeon]|nr:QueT transporter family protein [Candidatus Bathyarchaeota archaeon]
MARERAALPKTKSRIKAVALTAMTAAAYTVGVVALAPISFYIYQVRVADALLALSTIMGLPVIAGTTIGCAIANLYGGYGIVDIVGGSLANLIATAVGFLIARRKFRGSLIVALLAETLIVSAIVGGYLAVLFNVPLEIGFLGILVGSLISINLLGYGLVKVLKRVGHTFKTV